MRAILPGRPQAKLQAVTTGLWRDKQTIAYISGSALVILDGPNHVLQTTYHDEEESLEAVAFDEETGKVATCTKTRVLVYKPYGWNEGGLKWSLQYDLALKSSEDSASTLSWGTGEELLVGSSSLSLFATHNGGDLLWTRPLANQAKFAHFSYDASLIATTGIYDRMIKIWRRLSFDTTEPRFDYAYLPHPTTVTSIHWRRPFHREQVIDNILYTICTDNKVRIWAPESHHGVGVLRLWGQIDLLESIMPRNVPPRMRSKKRYAFIIDSRDFTIATERAVTQASDDEKEQHVLQHLIEVAKRSPEVCVVLDDRGNMSAWGLENVGSKAPRKASDIFNIAHVDDGPRIHFARGVPAQYNQICFTTFCGPEKFTAAFSLLVHHFDGRVEWLDGRFDRLFDPSRQEDRLHRETVWSGHSGAIKKIVRTARGRALISRTSENESIVWVQRRIEGVATLSRHSLIETDEHIHRMWLLHEGDFVVFLHHDSISLWDARGPKAAEAGRCQYKVKGKPLCLLLIPEVEEGEQCRHLATISSEMKGVAWEIRLPPRRNTEELGRSSFSLGPSQSQITTNGHAHMNGDELSLKQFCTFELGSDTDLSYVLPVDPAGSTPAISGFFDSFARDVAISYSNSGVIRTWTAKVNSDEGCIDWLETSMVQTGINNPCLASATSIRKAALIDSDRTTLSIWNTRSAQLEYQEKFEGHGDIQDLDWSSTPGNQSILAVGFPHRVLLYVQLRYDYLNAGPSWAAVREIRTRDITPHPIGDSVWLGAGHLVIGAGNQLFVADNEIEVSDTLLPDLRLIARKRASLNLIAVVSRLNGPLPVFHPQFLQQLILMGKHVLAQRILVNLYKKLKFYSEGDELDIFMGLTADDFFATEDQATASRKEMHSSYADFTDDDDSDALTEDHAASLNEKLTKIQVFLLSSHEQFKLADTVECVATVEKHRRSIDDNAGRFLLFFRAYMLSASQREAHSHISWREIAWAYHSSSQDILADLVSRHFHGRMLWKDARQSGLFMWLTDPTALRAQFELIARNEYNKTDERNPVDCSLYYLALKKKAVLIGLWRMATWSREQGATQRLLSNNFQDPRWKTAALKNAYALMGRRRFEYAAAFFLLADHLQDAVSVISNQMQDNQLAIAVARIYEGDDGPVLKQFLKDKILPQAVQDGNRWLATWAFWMLGRRDVAVRALVTPLTALLSPPATPNVQSKSFLTDDPALAVLYKQLRAKSLQALRGAATIPPRVEWDFVIRTAQLYERMGCDILALDLVRSWEFLAMPSAPAPQPLSPLPDRSKFPSHSLGGQAPPSNILDSMDIDPRKMLRRRSSLVVADLPSPTDVRRALQQAGPDEQGEDAEKGEKDGNKGQAEEKKEEKKKPPPTQFKEPDANSLLDSFGF